MNGIYKKNILLNFDNNIRCPGKILGKLSFIGHSLGGIIIRASLPYLAEF